MGTDTTTGDAPGPQRRSPLYSRHEALGASFTDFAGWDMPLQYSSALEEHRAVRERAGLFDLSHMGELWVRGPGAVELLNRTFVSDFAKLRIGRAKYTVLCNDAGGIVDDLIVYRLDGPSPFIEFRNSTPGVVEQENRHQLIQKALTQVVGDMLIYIAAQHRKNADYFNRRNAPTERFVGQRALYNLVHR